MKNADFWYAIFVLAAILSGAYALKYYLKRLVAGRYGGGDSEKIKPIKVSDRSPFHYPYTDILTIDGMVCETPDAAGQETCRELGRALEKW